jgi:hypothetical protein
VADQAEQFDPIAILEALERADVNYVVIGAFARVARGSGEVTEGLDVTPSMREDNASRLQRALTDLRAVRVDGEFLDLSKRPGPVIELRTRAGKLKLVPEPAGSRGYDDLRRQASRELLSDGLRIQIASSGDLARMIGALGREDQLETLLRMRRLIELERARSRSRGLSIER